MAYYASSRGTLLGTAKDFKARRAGFVVHGTMGNTGATVAKLHAMLASLDAAISGATGELVKRQISAYGAGGHHTHGGRPWRSLDASTLKRKAREGGPLDILVDTAYHGGGVLRDSIRDDSSKAKKTARGLSYVIRVVADAPVGRFHATGWTGPRGSGPARPPVEFTPADREYLMSQIRNAIGRGRR